jgi:hypothetical protein
MEAKRAHIILRVTDSEAGELRRAAAGLGVSLSTYLRAAIRQGVRAPLVLRPPLDAGVEQASTSS